MYKEQQKNTKNGCKTWKKQQQHHHYQQLKQCNKHKKEQTLIDVRPSQDDTFGVLLLITA